MISCFTHAKFCLSLAKYILKLKVHVNPFNVNNDWSSQYTTHYLRHFYLYYVVNSSFNSQRLSVGVGHLILYYSINTILSMQSMHAYFYKWSQYLLAPISCFHFKKTFNYRYISPHENFLIINAQFSMISNQLCSRVQYYSQRLHVVRNPWITIITIRLSNIQTQVTLWYICITLYLFVWLQLDWNF